MVGSERSVTTQKLPYLERNFEASLRMVIYEDWQTHTKTGFRPIKLRESWSGPHTNRMPSNNDKY